MSVHQLNKKHADQLKELEHHIRKLTDIGSALSKEKDRNKLLEMILIEAKTLSNADGGTLYMKENDDEIRFEIVMTDSLNFHMGGTSDQKVTFPNLKLRDEKGNPNNNQIATHVAITGNTINIADAYEAEGFDFSGTKAFDQTTGYRSKSFLTVPLKNHEDEIIGVLQLLNARTSDNRRIIPFGHHVEEIVSALASQAAITITNKNLVKDLRHLFESFIKVIAGAIDKKSPYTGGHCQRVPEITMAIAEAVNNADYGMYKDIHLSQAELYELHIAAWLHDAGKVTIPEYVVDKGTKLETIYDRIGSIEARFEIIKRDSEIKYLKSRERILLNSDLTIEKREKALKREEASHEKRINEIINDLEFLKKSNIGSEKMPAEDIERVKKIGRKKWSHNGKKFSLLTKDEVKNLTIPWGTLTEEERHIINNHAAVTIDMLEQLPYPKSLKNVPEIAGGHHETMDGKGYPKGLTRDEMSIQARMIAIADIFEALTAKDRPYKKGKTLSEALKILTNMNKRNCIDPDLFEIFIKEKVYEEYANNFLDPAQIDDISSV